MHEKTRDEFLGVMCRGTIHYDTPINREDLEIRHRLGCPKDRHVQIGEKVANNHQVMNIMFIYIFMNKSKYVQKR